MLTVFKKSILSVINFFGYDLYKIPNKKLIQSCKDSSNFWKIEFIGPPGVGKSTLYEKLIEKRTDSEKWITVDEFLSSCRLLNIVDSNLYNKYDDLLNFKLKNVIDLNIKSHVKYKILQIYFKNFQTDFTIDSKAYNYSIVLHEGLSHCFSDSLINLYKSNIHSFKEIMKNRAIVHCYTTPENIAERILYRNAKNGIVRERHVSLNRSELIDFNNRELKIKYDLVKILELQGIPCINIDTDIDIQKNIKKIQFFINNTIHKKL